MATPKILNRSQTVSPKVVGAAPKNTTAMVHTVPGGVQMSPVTTVNGTATSFNGTAPNPRPAGRRSI